MYKLKRGVIVIENKKKRLFYDLLEFFNQNQLIDDDGLTLMNLGLFIEAVSEKYDHIYLFKKLIVLVSLKKESQFRFYIVSEIYEGLSEDLKIRYKEEFERITDMSKANSVNTISLVTEIEMCPEWMERILSFRRKPVIERTRFLYPLMKHNKEVVLNKRSNLINLFVFLSYLDYGEKNIYYINEVFECLENINELSWLIIGWLKEYEIQLLRRLWTQKDITIDQYKTELARIKRRYVVSENLYLKKGLSYIDFIPEDFWKYIVLEEELNIFTGVKC